MTTALAAELRARTADAHARAEHAPFLAALAAGRVGRDGVVGLLVRLRPVHAALEQAGRSWAGDAVVGPFLLPGLERSDRIAADLAHLAGDAAPPAPPAARAYAQGVAEVAPRRAAFLAHHYTRVLGDLSGGQVLRAALERRLGLADGAGTSFFAFPGVRPGTARERYRALLDAAPLAAAEREELVAEALVAYELNVALVADLA